MSRLAPISVLTAALVVGAASARVDAQESVWTGAPETAHTRARSLHSRFVWARHDQRLLPSQRGCFDDLASRAGAQARQLEDRATLGRIPPWSIVDTHRQLDELEERARDQCTIIRDTDGEVERRSSRDPFMQRMPRDRAILRVGARFEMIPRVRRGAYALVPSAPLRGALGTFVVPWLRVEGLVALGWHPDTGPYGSVGGRAMITAPWALFRLGLGVEASVLIATDRLANIQFGWLGVQVGVPVEVTWELTDSFGLTLTGGMMYTQPGQAQPSVQAIGYHIGSLAEIVL